MQLSPKVRKTLKTRTSLSPDEIREISVKISQKTSEEEKNQIEKFTKMNLYQPHINEFLQKYSTLCTQSGIVLPTPYILVLGNKGCGKSSFIEAFLGRRIYQEQTTTNRIIRVHLIFNSKASTPVLQVQEERSSKFTKFEPEELPAEINKRNKEENLVRPVNIRIESDKIGFDLILIDTPPLDEQTLPQIKRVVTPHTHFVCLLNSKKLTETSGLKQTIESNFDPLLTSTTFVYTFLDSVLFAHDVTREGVNNFFNESFAWTQTNTHWVSLLKASSFEEQTANNEEKYNEALSNLYLLIHLQQKEIQWDPKFSHKLGFSVLRSYLLQDSWLKYKEGIPAIQRKLTRRSRQNQEKLAACQKSLNSLRPLEGRNDAVQYVTKFCTFIEHLMEGGLSVASLFPKDGCTLSEEKESCNFFSWPTSTSTIDFNSEEFIQKIEQSHSLLYGSSQMKRLLREFKAMIDEFSLGEIDNLDIESALGPRSNQTNPDNALAACSIVRQRTQEDFQPLVQGLVQRAAHILRLSRMMVENYMSLSAQYPSQLISAVKDLFDDFVEKSLAEAQKKISDEFHTTNTLHWYYKATMNPNEDVPALAKELYRTTKQQISSRALLILVGHFVLSITERSTEWQNIIVAVASYNSDEIEEFCDFSQRKTQLEKQASELEKVIEKIQKQSEMLQSLEDFPKVIN